ncbi:colicin release lysis protein [Escherichia coli]
MRKRFFVGIFAINLLVGCQANYIGVPWAFLR